jgi:hypothetical protein
MSTSLRFDPLGIDELESAFLDDDLRSARRETRRAFVEMKQLFMRAVENLDHRKAAWLRAQVRAAEDPTDLWLLRGPLLATLRENDVATRTMRAALYRTLDCTFPEAFGNSNAGARPAPRF